MRFIEAGRFVIYFLFLFFLGSVLMERLHWFWAVISITAGISLIDWVLRRAFILPAADREIQKLAEEGGAGQCATRFESDFAGGDKPQPESEKNAR